MPDHYFRMGYSKDILPEDLASVLDEAAIRRAVENQGQDYTQARLTEAGPLMGLLKLGSHGLFDAASITQKGIDLAHRTGEAIKEDPGTAFKAGGIGFAAGVQDIAGLAEQPGRMMLSKMLGTEDFPGMFPQGGDPFREMMGSPKTGTNLAADAGEILLDPMNLAGTGIAKLGAKLAASTVASTKSVGLLLSDPNLPLFIKQQLAAMWLHASPFKFDKFDLLHMGRGEGAQFKGPGQYLSGLFKWESPAGKPAHEVGGSHKFYRENMSRHEDLRKTFEIDGVAFENLPNRQETDDYYGFPDASFDPKDLFKYMDNKPGAEGGLWEEGVDTAKQRMANRLIEAEPGLKEFDLVGSESDGMLDVFTSVWGLWGWNYTGKQHAMDEVNYAWAVDRIRKRLTDETLTPSQREILQKLLIGQADHIDSALGSVDIYWLTQSMSGKTGLNLKEYVKAQPPSYRQLDPGELDTLQHWSDLREFVLRTIGGDDWRHTTPPGDLIGKHLNIKKEAPYSYQVDVPDEFVPLMIDLDAPMADQTPEVQKALGAAWEPIIKRDVAVFDSQLARADAEIQSAIKELEAAGATVESTSGPRWGMGNRIGEHHVVMHDGVMVTESNESMRGPIMKLRQAENDKLYAQRERQNRVAYYEGLLDEESAENAWRRLERQQTLDIENNPSNRTKEDMDFIRRMTAEGKYSNREIMNMAGADRVRRQLDELGVKGAVFDDGLSRNRIPGDGNVTRNMIMFRPDRDTSRMRRAQLGENGEHIGNRYITTQMKVPRFADDLPGHSVDIDELRGLKISEHQHMTEDQAEDIADQLFDQGQRHQVVVQGNKVIQGHEVARAAQMTGVENLKIVRVGEDIKPLGQPFESAFPALADAQRGAPEEAMRQAQTELGGGVMSVMVEHVGDLTHRMSERYALDANMGYEFVKPKVEKALDYLTSRYGFQKEHLENLEANARFRKVDLDEMTQTVTAALEKYANEHAKLPVYNDMQKYARDAAIELARGNYDGAIWRLRALKKELDKGPENWAKVASEYPNKPPPVPEKPPTPQIGDYPRTSIRQINKATREQGGQTVNLATGQELKAGEDKGFSVALTNNDPTSKKPALITPGDRPATQKELQAWVDRYPQFATKDHFLGTWLETKKVPLADGTEADIPAFIYYDLAKVDPNLRKAAWTGQQTGQKAVFELETFDTHWLGNWEEFINSPEFGRRVAEMTEVGRDYLRQFPMDWWALEGTLFEEIYGKEGLDVLAGFLAATSPQANPTVNIARTTEFMRRYMRGEPIIQPGFVIPDDALGLSSSGPGKRLGFEQGNQDLIASAVTGFGGKDNFKTQQMYEALRGNPNVAVPDLHHSRLAEDPTGLWKPNADNPEKVFLGPEAGTWPKNDATASGGNGTFNRARMFNIIMGKHAEKAGVTRTGLAADVWVGMRETIRTKGELFGITRTREQAVNKDSESWPLMMEFKEMIRKKAEHLGIHEGEMMQRLSKGDGTLLGIIVSTPLGAYVLSETLKQDPELIPNG